MMASKLGIIADDLTGAADTAARLAGSGGNAAVLIKGTVPGGVKIDSNILAVNTDTRREPKQEAYRRTLAAVQSMLSRGIQRIYKKLDSTLRGNVGAELDAMLDATGAELCIMAPSFPATGRVVIGGYLLCDGVPLERTAAAMDPIAPVRGSFVPAIVAAQATHPVDQIPFAIVAQGAGRVADEFGARANSGPKILVVDAVEERDLETVGTALRLCRVPTVLAGSAGFVPFAFGGTGQQSSHAASDDQSEAGPVESGAGAVLVVSGSQNPVALAQIDYASERLGVRVFRLSPIALCRGSSYVDETVQSAVEACRTGSSVALVLKGEEQPKSADGIRAGREIAQALAEVARQVLLGCSQVKPSSLVLIGGDTAAAVLSALSASGLTGVREAFDGVACGYVWGGPLAGLPAMTKAGGFGGKDAIVRMVQGFS